MKLYVTVTFFTFICRLTVFEASCPKIIERKEWKAKPAKVSHPLRVRPAPYVIIHHSETQPCTSVEKCKESVKHMQHIHMNNVKLNDIGFHFVIGGDGNIYEGRGWDIQGAHVIEFNNRSIGITLIGTFQRFPPSPIQLSALKNLIECGVQTKKITANYHLLGHRQINSKRSCPGDSFFELIKKMPHWDSMNHK